MAMLAAQAEALAGGSLQALIDNGGAAVEGKSYGSPPQADLGKKGKKGKGKFKGQSLAATLAEVLPEGMTLEDFPPGTIVHLVCDDEKWVCDDCGFKNRGANAICGGVGTLGCNAPKIKTDWVCVGCGFSNRALNTLCGGPGLLGCKKPRVEVAQAAVEATTG